MSLIQHVTSAEGVDRDEDTASLQLGRRLSLTINYDPIPNIARPLEKVEPVGAYEVPAWKRILQIVIGVISCVLASGIVFGFAALKMVLVREKVFRDECTPKELERHVRICYMQDQRLNLTFIIASVTTNMSALIVGALLDRFGPRFCGIASSVFLALGSLCMAFAQELPFDAYGAASFLLAFGGTFVFLPSFHLANAFPQFQGLILSLITGAFDASAAIYLFFRLLYESTNGNVNPKRFYLVYLVVPVFILLTQLFIMPSRSYESRSKLVQKLEEAKDPAQDLHDSDDELEDNFEVFRVRSVRAVRRKQSLQEIRSILGTEEEQQQYTRKEEEREIVSGVWGALHGVSVWGQFRSGWFILITLLTVLQMARFNFFIATIWSQYNSMLDSATEATAVSEFFDVALPIGGVATVPFIGLLLDNTSTVTVLNLLVLLSTLVGVLGVVPTIFAAHANVFLFVIFRPLYYSAISDYVAKVFGFATFGTIYGLIICLSGIFTFTQSALQALVHDAFDNNPGPVNLGLAATGLVIGLILVAYVDGRSRIIGRQEIVGDDDERRSLLHRTSRSQLATVQEYVGENDDRRSLLHRTSRSQLATVQE